MVYQAESQLNNKADTILQVLVVSSFVTLCPEQDEFFVQ